MTEPFVQTLCDLVAIPSCSDARGGEEAKVQAYVQRQMRLAGARVSTFEAADIPGFFEHPLCCGPQRNYRGRPTVIAEVGPHDGPALLVLAHSDTVSINNHPAQWKVTGPFVPVVRDGCVYGRGSSDDKWGVASMIHILRMLRDAKHPLRKRLIFVSTIDEENGVGNGLLLLQLTGIKAEAAFYLDGTETVLTIGNLGGSNLYMTPKSPMPRESLTAFETRLMAACDCMSAGRIGLFTSLLADNAMRDRSVFARLNEEGVLVIHFYTLPGEDGEGFAHCLEAEARSVLGADLGNFTFSYRTPWFEPTLLAADHPFVKLLAGSFEKCYGRKAIITTTSKQDSFVLRKFGLPTVGFGPGGSRGPGAQHLPDERMNIADAEAALRFAHRAILDWLER